MSLTCDFVRYFSVLAQLIYFTKDKTPLNVCVLFINFLSTASVNFILILKPLFQDWQGDSNTVGLYICPALLQAITLTDLESFPGHRESEDCHWSLNTMIITGFLFLLCLLDKIIQFYNFYSFIQAIISAALPFKPFFLAKKRCVLSAIATCTLYVAMMLGTHPVFVARKMLVKHESV